MELRAQELRHRRAGSAASALVGIVFGFVSARKTARLQRIEALRHG
jgi:ABC-type antimicrobial peptide transport system permease subunit